MGRVTGRDLRRILGFLGAAPAGTREDPLPQATLAALRDVVGADEAEYFELRRSDGAPLALTSSDDIVEAAGTADALRTFGWQNPIGWRRWSPEHGALRLSDQIRRREFERLGFYGEFMRPNGLRDALKVWLAAGDRSVACVHLWRHDRDFSRREQDILSILQQDLIRLRTDARRGRAASWPAASPLTAREAEVLIWAVRGHSHGEIAARLGASPRTVGKHLEHAYEKLDVRSRAQAVDRILLSGPIPETDRPGRQTMGD